MRSEKRPQRSQRSLLATGFRMMKIKEFPIADMIPAMVLVMPLSSLWTAVILPLVS